MSVKIITTSGFIFPFYVQEIDAYVNHLVPVEIPELTPFWQAQIKAGFIEEYKGPTVPDPKPEPEPDPETESEEGEGETDVAPAKAPAKRTTKTKTEE